MVGHNRTYCKVMCELCWLRAGRLHSKVHALRVGVVHIYGPWAVGWGEASAVCGGCRGAIPLREVVDH
jgi:hypothetical protein